MSHDVHSSVVQSQKGQADLRSIWEYRVSPTQGQGRKWVNGAFAYCQPEIILEANCKYSWCNILRKNSGSWLRITRYDKGIKEEQFCDMVSVHI
jgi:hypothetical protein